MSRSTIISKDGTPKATGYAEYNGSYLGVASLTFRQISSPSPITWEVGDYVLYDRLGGEKFKLYFLPDVTKRAQSGRIGDGFTYENLQFFAATKDLEIAPFRDFVLRDNRIHFSSREEASTFENVSGVKDRLQACMDDLFPGEWQFVLAETPQNPPSDITEAKEVSITGSVLDGLNSITENWKECGWRHSVENGVNVITIGFPSVICEYTPADFGIGILNGLLSVRQSYENPDEVVTRFYPFGSERNLPSKYYNGKDILNAASVDIPNLMLPLENWGLTEDPDSGEDKPDPAKAFIDNPDAIERFGLRPKRVYFDGSDGRDDIYPTLRGVTIGEIRSGYPLSEYPPSESWNDDDRVDEVINSIGANDSGDVSNDGKVYNSKNEIGVGPASGTYTLNGIEPYTATIQTITLNGQSKVVMLSESPNNTPPKVSITPGGVYPYEVKIGIAVRGVSSGTYGNVIYANVVYKDGAYHFPEMSVSSTEYIDRVRLYIYIRQTQLNSGTYTGSWRVSLGTCNLYEQFPIATTFQLRIPQIGFDINQQASLGSGIAVAMKDGKCAGRQFDATACVYESDSDTWLLTLRRQEDTSLNTLFPNNSGYQIAAGDHFVLLDIAMPDMYVKIAEQRLLAAARKELASLSTETISAAPDIDALYMGNNNVTIREGMRFSMEDEEGLQSDAISGMIIDALTISEGGASGLATYKITLRNTKRVTFKQEVSMAASAARLGIREAKANRVYSEKWINRLIEN